jgi:hypothetical protein
MRAPAGLTPRDRFGHKGGSCREQAQAQGSGRLAVARRVSLPRDSDTRGITDPAPLRVLLSWVMWSGQVCSAWCRGSGVADVSSTNGGRGAARRRRSRSSHGLAGRSRAHGRGSGEPRARRTARRSLHLPHGLVGRDAPPGAVSRRRLRLLARAAGPPTTTDLAARRRVG